MRYTVAPAAQPGSVDVQREFVDRLLELNHARYAEEVAKGLHDKKTTRSKVPRALKAAEGTTGELF
ncbi:hypothetical protein [Planomonospora sp. ID82291]|uniref:hypothetical protein n=1 Tax=Planomonospora sp. ID82291 TaxID=2738136 RepID=UPI0018C41806|nr:hypothetical protein [Planomonospora sp. ID82291]MBG0816941.1 hypothetical protein [Planomonospora sp. ID82291]